MDQQSKYKKADILDLSGDSRGDDQRVNVNEGNLRTEMKKNQNVGGKIMSEVEMKIRGELESDIERNLEEEIKDGIYHLALRLHRLYQHQKERKAGESLINDKRRRAFSEVNISIKMEGGTKIEIKESKKEAHQPRSSAISENVQDATLPVPHKKKFDWATSLRPGMDPKANNVNKKSGSASGQRRKGTGVGVVDTKVAAELGWKW